jgi:hypothetical protein
VGIAESLSVDGRGLIHLSGWDPHYFSFDRFPISWPIVTLAIFENDDPDGDAIVTGTPLTLTSAITASDGTVISTVTMVAPAQGKPFPDVPNRIQAAMGVTVTFPRVGDYRIRINATAEGVETSGERMIHVRRAQPPPFTESVAQVAALEVPRRTDTLRIVRAQYGAQGTWCDVTTTVQAQVHDAVLRIGATNIDLGVDPLPGVEKELVIEYDDGERVTEERFQEGAFVVLP